MFSILFGWLLATFSAGVFAQQTSAGWSIPVKLHEVGVSIREPALAADQRDALHAFWTAQEDSLPMALFYARWENGVWTQPVDIVAMEGIQGPSAAVDPFGTVHLIWFGPGNTLYYSSADASVAPSALAWSTPVQLAKSNPHAHLVIDSTGTLHVVYPALLDGGVNYISSADGGMWSEPILVAERVHADATTDFTRLAVSPNGDLHVVWTELTLPEGWPPLGIYYAKSGNGGRAWSGPLQLSGDGFLEANIATVGQSGVHIAWNAMASISGRYHQWSNDLGNTWSSINTIVPPEMSGGSTGPPGLAIDSSGGVHVVVNTADTVPREGPGEFGATMYSYWTGSNWSPAVNVSSPAPDYLSLHNEESALAITAGNRLHVLFFGDDTTTLWHTTLLTTAPEILPAATTRSRQSVSSLRGLMAGLEAVRTVEPPDSISQPLDAASTTIASRISTASPPATLSPAAGLAVAIIPALLLVGGVTLFTLLHRRSR